MLLTGIDRVVDRPGHSAEVKWDGFRLVGHGAERVFISRRGRNLTQRFPELSHVSELLAHRRAIVDGEVVAIVNGVPDFSALQARDTPAIYIAFDILALDGEPTDSLPLHKRRALLEDLIPKGTPTLIRSRAFPSAVALLAEAEQRGLEGVVIKNDDSAYCYGPTRTRHWLKIKTSHGRAAEQHRQMTWGHRPKRSDSDD